MELSEFTDNWHIVHTLGEGAFGTVKLVINTLTKEAVAVKIIDINQHANSFDTIRKEITIHKQLKHPHIIQFLGQRRDNNEELIFLEYASGGELFDRIEPDIGMDVTLAQSFMRDLISGVSYLHENGFVHRDLKPENLLIDANDRLKISDFGMAAMFRFRSLERPLHKRCGTMPYIAPEVINEPEYAAKPVDVWSTGVILVAMLTGELPWDKPDAEGSEQYLRWKSGNEADYVNISPWIKLNPLVISLIRGILEPDVSKRYYFDSILSHEWMMLERDENTATDLVDSDMSSKKMCLRHHKSTESSLIIQSQPIVTHEKRSKTDERTNKSPVAKNQALMSFSQPVQTDNLFVTSQKLYLSKIPLPEQMFETLVRRMTRLFVPNDTKDDAVDMLCSCLDKLGYSWNFDASGNLSISTIDSRKSPLVFKVVFVKMNLKLLIDFRLSKGCGLDFKRKFLKIKNCLNFFDH